MLAACILCAAAAMPLSGQDATVQGEKKRVAGLLIFDLNPASISPPALSVEEGWYLVRVRNGISSGELSVVLDDESKSKVIETTITARRSSGTQKLVLLRPGKHTLRVGQRAAWTATVDVQGSKKDK